jgi:hypothetical protein
VNPQFLSHLFGYDGKICTRVEHQGDLESPIQYGFDDDYTAGFGWCQLRSPGFG